MHRRTKQFIRQSMKSKEKTSKKTKIIETIARKTNMILPFNRGLTKEQMEGIKSKGVSFLISDSSRTGNRRLKHFKPHLESNNRKPTNARGVKTRLVVKHLIETFKEIDVKASINKAREIMREKFTYEIPVYKSLTHERF